MGFRLFTGFGRYLQTMALFAVVVTAISSQGLAQTQTQQGDRPKIGLALSGGGARGAAHVGVLRVLEEMRIPVDYIAGASMGSIIGGLYAAGMTPDEIETALVTMDWEHIFSDDAPREDRSFRRKRDDDLYLIKAKPGISDDGELKFPTGAIQGQKFDLALRELTLPVTAITDFDKLHIPFRAVASDIGTGKSVVIRSGDLATAMRASMAVPAIFSATEIEGRLLVDGGITDNLPIDVVRDMGADIVIAVDISTPLAEAEDVTNVFSITGQLTSIMTRTNAEQQIASLAETDVLIVPDLGDIGSGDFQRAGEAVPRGRDAAKAKRQQLAALGLSLAAYRDYVASLTPPPLSQSPIIHFVRIENDSPISDGMIRDRLRQAIGEPLDRKQLEQDISTIYGLELFQNVRYDVEQDDGLTGLVVSAKARSWGPNYVQFGLELSSDGEGRSSYNLGFAYLRTGINGLGGELRAALQVGEEPLIAGEWYQPLDTLSRYFLNTGLSYGSHTVSLFDDQDRLADFRVTETRFDGALGREFGVYGETRFGYRYRTGQVELQTGAPELPDFSYDTAELYGRVSVDRLDSFNFPENGWTGLLEYATAREALGGDKDFDQATLRGSKFAVFGDGHVLGLGGRLETTLDGNAAIQDRYRLGGFLNLSGFTEDSLSGQQAGIIAALYYRRFEMLPFLSWYIGTSLEYGGTWENRNDIGDDGLAAGSIFLGADTPIGPIYLGVGQAEAGNNAVFFYLGRPMF